MKHGALRDQLDRTMKVASDHDDVFENFDYVYSPGSLLVVAKGDTAEELLPVIQNFAAQMEQDESPAPADAPTEEEVSARRRVEVIDGVRDTQS